LPPAKTEPTAPEIRKLADPLFGPVQPRPEVPSSADDANSPLRDVRLTGVVIGPDLRIAIFAVSGADSLVLSEGETLKDWRLDRVSPGKVLLSGPAGTIKLEAKPDANLVHAPTPVAVRPGPELAGALEQPTGMTPMPAGNLSAAIPVQAQGYPHYLPENYAGYEQDYLSYNYYPYPYPYFAYVVPIGFAFRFGFFHRHDIHHGAFHGGDHPEGGGSGRSPKRAASPTLRDGVIPVERTVHDGGPDFQHQMSAPWRPAHLLLGSHSPMQQPLHRALGDRR
jgi:hypothetical protein